MQNDRTLRLRWVALAVLLAGGFLPPMDFFIVNVALSSIHDSLGATPAQLQLVISCYSAAYAVFLVTGGRMGDLYGRRRCFLWGLAGFSLSSLCCGLAPSPAFLIAGRLAQGACCAALQPQILASIRALFPEEQALAKAMSAYASMMGIAGAVGQFSGGALIEWNPWGLGWRAVFLLTLPLAVAVLALAARLVPETGGGRRVHLDLGGAALISLALAAVVVPLSLGRENGWPPWTFAALGSVPVLLAWFARYEARQPLPLIDMSLFRIPSFSRGTLVAALFYFTTSFYLLFGIYQQEGRGVPPLQTGLAIAPYGVGLFLGPILTAPLVRLRPRLLALGMGLQVAAYVAVGALVALGVQGPALPVAVLLAGAGQGIAFPRLFQTLLGDVPADKAGVATGIFSTGMQVGAAVSVAAIGGLFFGVLGQATGERAYARAFAVAQWAVSAGLFVAMLLAVPRAVRTGPALRPQADSK